MTIQDFDEIFPGATVIEVDPRGLVLCDICNENFTNRPDQGGFLYLSKGVCPECAPEFEATLMIEGEHEYIRARCPPGRSFADWIRADVRRDNQPTPDAVQVRQILLANVVKMVEELAENEIDLRVLVDDLSNYGNYLLSSSMLEDNLTREEMREIFHKRIEATLDEAFANNTKGNL